MTTNRRPRVEPSADMRAGMRQLYEMFVALVDAGFTERQALQVIGDVTRASIDSLDPPVEGP